MANAPAFTTATACSSAVTGVGATPAWGSQELNGLTAAFTPKPQKAITYISRRSVLLSPLITAGSSTPPKVKLIVVP